MRKRNLWNRIFHSKQLFEEYEKYKESKSLVGFGPEILQFIEGANNLYELLDAHKKAWVRGYHNENLGPCEYGMFRTNDIASMSPDEVYLGNIYGLWTFPLSKWAEHTPSPAGLSNWGFKDDVTDVDLIMRQYRKLLTSNVRNIIDNATKYIKEYEM